MKEVLAFVAGYLAIVFIADGPNWAGMIGGWILGAWINLGSRK